jgi:hypothetical protein
LNQEHFLGDGGCDVAGLCDSFEGDDVSRQVVVAEIDRLNVVFLSECSHSLHARGRTLVQLNGIDEIAEVELSEGEAVVAEDQSQSVEMSSFELSFVLHVGFYLPAEAVQFSLEEGTVADELFLLADDEPERERVALVDIPAKGVSVGGDFELEGRFHAKLAQIFGKRWNVHFNSQILKYDAFFLPLFELHLPLCLVNPVCVA